ncbi:MAG: hypothetical protein QM726_04715 [Chitinophagaceae bacterium]
MTKIYSTMALLLFALTTFSQAPRRLIKATTSGAWTNAATWTTTGTPTTPGDNDSIVIASGINVTISGNGVNLGVQNSVLDIFGTLTFNEPSGASKTNNLNITTNTSNPVYVIRLANNGSITKGSNGNGSGNINIVVNGGTSQLKYSTQTVANVPDGQTAGPTITGPANAQNTTGNPQYFTMGSNAALPVSINLFKAVEVGTSVTVSWSSLQEINTNSYVVEKSANGTNWQAVGTLAAAGYSATTSQYQFTDDKPAAVNYYRLKMVDNDGRVTYSNILVVRSQNKGVNVSLFPNPAVNNVNISIGQQLAQQGFTIRVMNQKGQLIIRRQIAEGVSTLSFDVSSFKTGTYTMDIQFTGGVRESHQLVIVK